MDSTNSTKAMPAGRQTIGVIGTGKIGSAVATVLARNGHRVMLHNRTLAKAQNLAAAVDGTVAAQLDDLPAQCQVVVSCLTGWDAVSSSYHGSDGLLTGSATSARIFVHLETLDPSQVQQIGAAVQAAGHHFLYASVSGRPIDLEQGRGFVMTSGAADVAEQVIPVLRRLGVVRYVGQDPAHAAAMKLAVNLMVFASLCSTGEALALAERSGIDRGLAYDLLLESPVGSSMLELRRQAFVDPEQVTVQATVDLTLENYEAVRRQAAATGTCIAQAEATSRIFADASAEGFGRRDATSIAAYIRNLAENISPARPSKSEGR